MGTDTKIVLAGDSVLWGQGLLSRHKYSTFVCKRLAERGTASISDHSHSGAVIEEEASAMLTPSHQEVPLPGPSVLDQLQLVQDPSNVDWVFLNGGINDVGIWRLLDPFRSSEEVRQRTYLACYTRMKKLFRRAAETFTKPSCRLVVTGYYPILSPESNLANGTELNKLLEAFGNASISELPITTVAETLVDRSMRFWQESEQLLAMAVLESKTKLKLGDRLVHVPSPFAPSNALFTRHPWLFGFGQNLQPQDEVVGERTHACALHYPTLQDFGPRKLCEYASVGHPNRLGAAAMAQAILDRLQV